MLGFEGSGRGVGLAEVVRLVEPIVVVDTVDVLAGSVLTEEEWRALIKNRRTAVRQEDKKTNLEVSPVTSSHDTAVLFVDDERRVNLHGGGSIGLCQSRLDGEGLSSDVVCRSAKGKKGLQTKVLQEMVVGKTTHPGRTRAVVIPPEMERL